MINGNRYIVISADSGIPCAEELSQFIKKYLQQKHINSLCYIYEDIQWQFNTFADDEEKLSQFFDSADQDIDFRNIYLMFLFTSDPQFPKTDTIFDQQLLSRAGKIIGKFSLKSTSYKNQISFWIRKGAEVPEVERKILGGSLREFDSDFKAISRYIDAAERQTDRLKTNSNNLHRFQNKEMKSDVSDFKENISLTEVFNHIDAFLKALEDVPDVRYEVQMEIKVIIKKENGEIVSAPKFIEIVPKIDGTVGGL